ncbi:MAG TPA: efflux RND transporter permease subunit [Caldithrix abyssi]|uniref:Efflux RND transporter permease subunit n=1 Tax=Caldithrix abyssi TaxID=187145 RepID=A0A7V1PTX1_CALAY|nr:efflux RND transporter permease subunit [Caldithrix abyssi]
MSQQSSDISKTFYKFTTTRPVAILMVVIGVVVFGVISYQQLPLNLMPDMTYPSLTVRTEYPGAAPEEVETSISRPVEQALGVVDNLVSISSISKAEQSDVILDFTWDTDMDKATADVREKLDQVFLPDDAKRPLILRFDPSLDPIMRLALYGKENLTYIRYIGEEQLKRALETIDGVAAVKVKGGLEEEIRVELNERAMTQIGMNIETVKSRLSEENVNLAGGNLKEGQTEYLVRTLNEFRTLKEIEELVVGRFNNVDIKIKDVGHVYRTHKERQIITRVDGKESVEIEIYKEADANIVEVAHRVKDRLYGTKEQREYVAAMKNPQKVKKEKKPEPRKNEKKGRRGRRGSRGGPMDREAFKKAQMTNFLAYELPGDIKIETLSDQSIFIESSVNEVKETAITGGLLAIIVLFVFLRLLSPTVIIALSIPISIIATFAPMKIFGVSLNIMSLGGLALGVGMLVDNSIVVLESISRRREKGDSLVEATIRGVSEVGGAVTASTLTTVAVFFPIVFVQGVAGQVFGDMALTIVFSLLASLAVALFLIPMLSSRQISSFTRAGDLKALPAKYILNMPLKDKVDAFFSREGEKDGKGFTHWIGLMGQTVSGWFGSSLKVLIFVLLSVFKIAGVTVATLFTPLLFWLKPGNGSYTAWLTGLSRGRDPQEKKTGNPLWVGYEQVNSTPLLFQDFRGYFGNWSGTALWMKILKVFFAPLMLAFYLLKFITYATFEILFRVIHGLVLIIGLLIYMLIMLFRLLLTVPTRMVVATFDWGYGLIEKGYPRLLTAAIQNRWSMLAGVLILFVLTVFGLGPRLGSELIPEVAQGEFFVELRMPIGTPVEETDERIIPIVEKIATMEGVAKVASVAGTDKSATSDSEEGENTAKLTVTITPGLDFESMEQKLIHNIRSLMQSYPGISANIARPTLFSFKTPIEVHLKGYSLAKLQKYSRNIEQVMANIPGVVDAKSNIQRGNPEVQIYYDRKRLALYGLNVLQVANIVRNKIRGDVATEFRQEDRKIDVLVRLRESDKESIDDLRRIVVNPGSPVAVQLNSVAEIRINEGPSEIRRVDQTRTAVITANVEDGYSLSEISGKIYEALVAMDLPQEFTFELAGQNKEMETSLNSLILALALAIFLVYIVMASQFESLVHPFIIIFTIPLALIGVIIFLYLLGIPLSIVVFLGLIMLAGIVVNNAIVLVDFINQLRERGLEKRRAILEAGQTRLRPILMTTMTTVLGLLPMALGLGDGAEIRTPMAITVIVGLLSSTLLTLVVIPVVYDIVTGDKKPQTESDDPSSLTATHV